MNEARASIAEKMRAIKKAQDERSEEERHVHDPSNFTFIKTTRLKNIHSGVYFYSKKINFLRRSAK